MMRSLAILGVSIIALAACGAPEAATGTGETSAPEGGVDAAPEQVAQTGLPTEAVEDVWPIHRSTSPEITAEDFAYRIATLADDRFGGRGPASELGEPAAQWIATEMERAGLEPAGVDGSWFQPVPAGSAH